MANNRKLQTEIDKLIKKANEGMEVYDEMYEKVQDAGSQPLKEKHEAELKKEIKKLQRLREAIKGHIASPDVKDKKQLEQYRRFIEEKMESFKVCERETKTKTFSKEGLALSAERQTPVEKAEEFLRQCISDLNEITEQLEFDLQSAGGGGGGRKKKKGGKGGGGGDEKQEKFTGLKTYTLRLEQVLRCVSNEEIEPEEVDEMKDEVENFISECNDSDTFDNSALDIFEAFDLPELGAEKEEDEVEEEKAAPPPAAAPKKVEVPSTPKAVEKSPAQAEGGRVVMKKANEPASPAAAPAKTVVAKKDVPAPAAAPAKQPLPKASVTVPSPASQQPAQAPAAQQNKKQVPLSQQPGKPVPQSPMKGATQDQSALLGALEDDDDALNDDTFGDDETFGGDAGGGGGGGLGGGSLADMAGMTQKMMERGDWDKGRLDFGKNKAERDAASAAKMAQEMPSLPTLGEMTSPSKQQPQKQQQKLPQEQQNAVLAAASSSGGQQQQQQQQQSPAARMFEMSYNNLPDAKDCERSKSFVPPNPYQTPAFYPQEVHKGFTNPELFSKLDPDTLFFIFYYQQQSYQQFLAAKELKKQSWRYHKKFHTWFQRHDKPLNTTEEFERGAYVYFDYENGWCQRIKTDFTFKYQYLEDELQ